MPQAVSVAAELKKDFGVEPALIKGSHGIFDVKVDGKTVYSKDKTGRFPEPGEVSALLKEKAP
jgi:selT/selW/selH-like putative selenoprotein